ncbi:MAG: hypothetical protein PHE59_01265 [Patescibacteria group bacterium]|nr:hypothetical protein [Patescibacteria group bacterium]MDD5535018.1 hypothetical protein [Patescibacteria group bacterium]
MKKIIYYIICVIVFIVSFLATLFLPVNEIFKGILTFPGIVALLSVLYQLWRDERAHERVIELQNKQQDFILGTASHMADVVYNKHVEFCEEYIDRVQEGFQELLRDGVSKNALIIGGDLIKIRQKHSAWLTQEIEKNLKPFEQALIKIGAKEGFLQDTRLLPGEERKKIVDEVYRSFGLVLGHETPMSKEEADMKIDTVIEKIREILGINILTDLRLKAAELAKKRISDI